MSFRTSLNTILHRTGYEVAKAKIGVVPHRDLAKWIRRDSEPLILDIGANVGQSITGFKKTFPRARIHSFEPQEKVMAELRSVAARHEGVTVNNLGVGRECGSMTLVENASSDMSSFLEPGPTAWGEISARREVAVTTIDDYCASHELETVDLIKSDAQGYDLQVMKGATRMFEENRVRLVLTEMIISRQYEGLPPFHEFFGHMIDAGFQLVTFYQTGYQEGLSSWLDALFVNLDYVGATARETNKHP
jgi:FkbM family methyltransferase